VLLRKKGRLPGELLNHSSLITSSLITHSTHHQVTDTAKNDWVLTSESFDVLLTLLDPEDRERAGQKYAELRDALERFFEWRGASHPEELADETLNRVARRVEEGEPVREVQHYCLGVARLILLESFKKRAREEKSLGEFSRLEAGRGDAEDEAGECLAGCLNRLTPENRELVIRYYDGEGGDKARNRRTLIERLRLPASTLRMRVLRLRQGLEECVGRCLKFDRKL
jgi:DNA-directed RNA polymerase specialized sigma24 family protein